MRPERIWYLSTRCYARGWVLPARLLKTLNYLLFRAVLPYEVQLGRNVTLWHRGLGTVVHPNIKIGDGVRIGHGVTIAGTDSGRSVIESGTTIAANATVIPSRMQPYTIGRESIVGAAAIVVGSVPPRSVARSPKAEVLPRREADHAT